MVLLDWVVNNWYWAAGGYALAFAVYVTLYVRADLAKLRAHGYVYVPVSGADSGADSDSDADCRANLALAVERHGRRRAIPNSDHWNPAGRRAADSDSVCADAQAVA